MINKERLLEILIGKYGKDIQDNDRSPLHLKDGRKKQYDSIFGEELLEEVRTILGDLTDTSAAEITQRNRIKTIFEKNESIGHLKDCVQFRTVDTIKEASKKISFNDGTYVVLLDTHTMKFLWMMNKAFLYGQEYLSEEDNRHLYLEIFLHFSTLLNIKEIKALYPQPKTPSHKSLSSMTALTFFVEVQETFILCHEIAHILVDDKKRIGDEKSLSATNYLLKYDVFFPSSFSIDEELAADDLAFDMTLNVFGNKTKESVEIVCTAIFLMIRYFMWLRMVYVPQQKSDPNTMDKDIMNWFARNSFAREKINKAYKWGSPIFIVNLFDHLESILEPASLAANEEYEKIIASVTS